LFFRQLNTPLGVVVNIKLLLNNSNLGAMHTYIFAICCFLSLSFNTMETCSVTVQFTNLRNTKGLVQAALLNGSQGFPDDPKQRFAIGKTAISGKTATIVFTNVPVGKYVVVVMHDENSNTKLEKNFLGIPKEGFGFSNNPRIIVGAPSYETCEFEVKTNICHIVEMKYIL